MTTKKRRKPKTNKSRDHYVGRGYLRPWQQSNGEVWVIDKKYDWRVEEKSTKSICFKWDYNTPEIEKKVGDLESILNRARTETMKKDLWTQPGGGVINPRRAKHLLDFASLYLCHSPDTREQIVRNAIRTGSPLEDNQVAHISMILHRNLSEHLENNFSAFIVPAPEDMEFITSDMPVFIPPIDPNWAVIKPGLTIYDLTCTYSIERIYFPLSPKYLLIAYPNKYLPPLSPSVIMSFPAIISPLKERFDEDARVFNETYASNISRWVISKNRELLEDLKSQFNREET